MVLRSLQCRIPTRKGKIMIKKILHLISLLLFLAGCKPAVSILSPIAGTTFDLEATVPFIGSAVDLQDGSLADDSLVWKSNIDGEIETGNAFSKDDLSEGTHTITLAATNSQGETGTDAITITIGESANMVLIPAGEFEMGCQDDECKDDELPVHAVYLDALYIDKYEVTNRQYASFLNTYGNNCDEYSCYGEEVPYGKIEQASGIWTVESGYEDHPANYVTWHGASEYCTSLGKRLPTEAECEKTSRGGLEGKKYPWGDTEPDCTYANAYGCLDDTTPVGSYSPNDYGLYDMAGNVWEWASDWYDFYYYEYSPYSNPTGPDSGSLFYKVLRGGGWNSNSAHLRSAQRDHYYPGYHYWAGIGFRCVKDTQ